MFLTPEFFPFKVDSYLSNIFKDCNTSLVNNGFCDDETNTENCFYDGGDCCGPCVIQIFCTVCECIDSSAYNLTPNPLVANGFCNDETNNADCSYDGGDCCGTCINTDFCSQCECFGEVIGNGIPNSLIDNGFCNDETNNQDCWYDGNDCCGSQVNTDDCFECSCTGGIVTSPGFPDNYELWIDWTHLIQVPPGKLIQIIFLLFDVPDFCR